MERDQISSSVEIPDHQGIVMGQGKDSQPTKKKVVAFKARVFKLLQIFCRKSPSIDPLISSITEEALMKDTKHLNLLVETILSKEGLKHQQSMGLLKAYRSLLLYKSQDKEVQEKVSGVFSKLLKKTVHHGGDQLVGEMFETYYTKRNCRVNAHFFQYITRKVPATKTVILRKCEELGGRNIRPAQKKQIAKMKNKLSKRGKEPRVKDRVKEEEVL